MVSELANVKHGRSELLEIVQCRSPATRHEVWDLEEIVGSAVRLHHAVFEFRVVRGACSAGLDEESGRRAFMCVVMNSAICLCSESALTCSSPSCCVVHLSLSVTAVPLACGACVLACGLHAGE